MRKPETSKIRVICVTADDKFILLEQFNKRLNAWDYSLPEFKTADVSEMKVKNFIQRTFGGEVNKTSSFYKSSILDKNVADIEFFVAKCAASDKMSLKSGKSGIKVQKASWSEVKKLCLSGNVHDDRNVAAILRFMACS